MDLAPEEVIHGELGPGEEPLWSGQPRQGFVLRAADVFLIPFSLLWGGFVIFWEVAVLVQGAPWFFALFGVPFVLTGLHMILGRFWVDARQRASTFYAVTSERIILVSGRRERRVRSLSLDTLADVSLIERGNGSGMITFGPVHPIYSAYGAANWPGFGHHFVPNFDLADQAREVYELIRAAQWAARHGA